VALDAEVGVIGFGDAGISVAGSGGVPALPSTYGRVLPGYPRSFAANAPDLAIYLEGQNDPHGTDARGLGRVICALLAAAPGNNHLVLAPLSGRNSAATRAALAEVASAHVVWHGTSGWIAASSDTCDGVHPHARAHRTRIAPKIIALVRRLLPAR